MLRQLETWAMPDGSKPVRIEHLPAQGNTYGARWASNHKWVRAIGPDVLSRVRLQLRQRGWRHLRGEAN